MTRPVRLHIDRLVLDPAFAHLDRAALGAALEAELGRRLAEDGVPERLLAGAGRARLDGGRIDGSGRADPETFARRIADSLLGEPDR